MMNAERVLAAVKASGARKIALIDDAFDAPVFKEAHAVALLEFLEDETSSAALTEAAVTDDLRAAAIAAREGRAGRVCMRTAVRSGQGQVAHARLGKSRRIVQ